MDVQPTKLAYDTVDGLVSLAGKRTMCLLLGTGFSLRKSFSVRRTVGGRSDSKKFEDHSGTARLVMRSYWSHSGTRSGSGTGTREVVKIAQSA